VVLAVGLAGCDVGKTTTILDVDCGTLKLRFEERFHSLLLSNTQPDTWEHALLLDKGLWRWALVSKVDAGTRAGAALETGVESFARFLQPEVAYHELPLSGERSGVMSFSRHWSVFVDPALVSRKQYDAIAACLATNATAVDRAFVARATGPRAQLSSVLYSAHDPQFSYCGARTLGARWECAQGSYIKTRLGADKGPLVLCVADAQTSALKIEIALGEISADRKGVFLRDPEASPETIRALFAGRPARDYYARCRDASGKGFFDAFELAGDTLHETETRANALFEAGRYEQALALYRNVVSRPRENVGGAQTHAWAHRAAGQCLVELGRGREAAVEYRAAVALAKYDHAMHYEVFKQLVALEPENGQTRVELGRVLYELERYPEAIAAFDQARRICATCIGNYEQYLYDESKQRVKHD
jgi:hypothetical protein